MFLIQGCALHGLSFVQDDRVRIIAPSSNATAELPLEVRWEVDGYDGRFGVFFDRSPIRPGQSLRSLVGERDPCNEDADCPDEQWLAERDVYVTDDNRLVVERLTDQRATKRASDRHEMTIVLLDRVGRRVGESAFTTEFIIERGD